ncbi:MAG TPA: cysteine peptidase family C39 domain-containing protein [Planctomycetota bacterium]|nr:cysteine peptidase family C39 domain-containing protein [Planctomycetota bacterium]
MEIQLELDILRQPDNTSCGPTCLQAIYRYYGQELALEQVIAEVDALDEGGTLEILLGCHALKRGFQATIFSYNVQIFDPTWYQLSPDGLKRRLERQRSAKPSAKLHLATSAYLEFLDRGGRISFEDLSGELLERHLTENRPILAGLSATYLYKSSREYGPRGEPDDIRGLPVGHFVVLCGYDRKSRRVLLADPMHPNPLSQTHTYAVDIDRLVGAIFLGAVTHDANLLVIEPELKKVKKKRVRPSGCGSV